MEDELKMVSVVNDVEVVDDVCNCTAQQLLVVIADGGGDGDFHLLNFYWMIGVEML